MATVHRVRVAPCLPGDLLSVRRIATVTGEEGAVRMAESNDRHIRSRLRGSQESWPRGRKSAIYYRVRICIMNIVAHIRVCFL